MRMFRAAALVALLLCTAVVQAGPGVLTPTSPNARENDSSVTVSVSRQNGTTGVVTVDYETKSGSAIAGREFVPVSGTLTFQDGEKTKSVTIELIDNATYDGNRKFQLALTNPTGGATIATYPVGTVDFYDDELPPRVSIDDIRITEGNSGTSNAEFTISITSVTRSIDIRILWYTNDYSAVAGSDFQSSGGTFWFKPADTQKTITVPVYGDLEREYDERFFVYIYGGATFPKQYGYCTIVDDDWLLSIITSDVTIAEGSSGRTNAVITLSASEPLTGVTVNYLTVDGTATAGHDFDFTHGTLFFPGETQKRITIPIIGDTEVETDEQFTVRLVASGQPVTLDQAEVTATIVNDDLEDATVTISELSPNTGSVNGGTIVTITGANFNRQCKFKFGHRSASDVVYVNSTTMIVTTPPHGVGPVDVTATCGSETFTLTDAFTYTPVRRRASRSRR